jgi:alkylated DNA repair protein alkB family protein 1
MPHLPDPQSSYTPFRQAEKHFKSRLIPHTTPFLPPDILDLSRPATQEDDEVWRSGWWGPIEDEGSVRYRRRKGKERDRGERGPGGGDGLEKVDLGEGKIGYLVSDGVYARHLFILPLQLALRLG